MFDMASRELYAGCKELLSMLHLVEQQQIREENRNLLEKLKRLVARTGSEVFACPSNEEKEFIKILGTLESIELDRVADTGYPIFKPSMGGAALEQLASGSDLVTLNPAANVASHFRKINEELLFNRWCFCRSATVELQIRMGLTTETVEWFRKSTFEKIKLVADAGINLTQLNVGSKFIYHAAKGLNLGPQHRNVMSLCIQAGRA